MISKTRQKHIDFWKIRAPRVAVTLGIITLTIAGVLFIWFFYYLWSVSPWIVIIGLGVIGFSAYLEYIDPDGKWDQDPLERPMVFIPTTRKSKITCKNCAATEQTLINGKWRCDYCGTNYDK